METITRYCYRLQAWIVGGEVDRCGHVVPSRACYACAHAGGQHALDCTDCH